MFPEIIFSVNFGLFVLSFKEMQSIETGASVCVYSCLCIFYKDDWWRVN